MQKDQEVERGRVQEFEKRQAASIKKVEEIQAKALAERQKRDADREAFAKKR